MTSKEALKNICLECEKEKGKNKIACPFRSISNDYCEEYEKIKKDLEILNIIKSSIYNEEIHKYTLDEKFKGQKFMIIGLIIREEDYINKINEWLENGQRKNDRNLQ